MAISTHFPGKDDHVLIRVIVFLIVALLLLLAVVVFIQVVLSTFTNRSHPSQIAPFRIIGKEDKDGALGIAMAHELRARLGVLLKELNASGTQIDQARLDLTYQPLGIPLQRVEVPNKIFEPLNINFKLSGVELGGVFSRFHNLVTTPATLKFVVDFQGDQPIIAGNLDIIDGTPLYEKVESGGNDAIVTEIAYAIYQRQLTKKIHPLSALSLKEFRSLIDRLQQTANLNRKIQRQTVTEKDYKELLSGLREYVGKLPEWNEFIHLTAEIAKNANEHAEALSLFQRELKLLPAGGKAYKEVKLEISQLEETIEVASIEPKGKKGDLAPTLRHLRESRWGKEFLKKLEPPITRVTDKAAVPSIAILGSPPSPNLLSEEQQKIIDNTAGEQNITDYEQAYTDNLVRLILMIAPYAKFSFTPVGLLPGGGYTGTDMVKALNSLLSASPDILLITYGPLSDPTLQQFMYKATERGTVVVTSAMPVIPGYEQILPIADIPNTVTVAGITDDGQPVTPIQSSYDKQALLWVPASNIPVLTPEGKIEPRSDHVFAAAIVAGIIWHMKNISRTITPAEILQTLTSSSRKTANNFRVIQSTAAIETLQRLSTALRVAQEKPVGLDIPDNDPQGISSTIKITETGNIVGMRVTVNIQHTYVGDLTVLLLPPEGNPIMLHDREEGSKDDITKTYSTEFSSLTGKSITGEWKLRVSDHSRMDTGKFISWALNIEYEK